MNDLFVTDMSNIFGNKDDTEEADYNDVICDSLANADKINIVEARTGENMRDQWNTEEVTSLHQDSLEKRRFNWRKN